MIASISKRRCPAPIAGRLAAAALLLLCAAAQADVEATGADGTRYLLRDDGTWRKLDAKAAPSAQDEPATPAVLHLLDKADRGPNCRLTLRLVNDLPYEIRHIVPSFAVSRTNGVVHETLSVGFQSIRPGDRLERTLEFNRIACADIARVQVEGGDRCDMGDLNKFSDPDGRCLARIRLAPSSVARFDK